MTTFTNNHNEQLFTELTPEEAAIIQAGWDLIAYNRKNGRGRVLGKFNFGSSRLSARANNKISSVRIKAGRWKFADWYYGLGKSVKIRKRGLFNFIGFNNKTSSIYRF